ncbi:glycosyl transferase [Neptunitalea chrysea]|uniref:Glycosyl transferase n=1 Tax=Neptunitalea chrysea TaxID=1647581 RepID=A0A9W6EV37_9FLAO|nr:glycosyltransferase [Neptunitalea chrysea]GLB52057.1 glycosyl transferase [Neptunitalea chrysea]
MKFLIITHVEHSKHSERYYGYAPYIREMNLWLQYCDEVEVIAPLEQKEVSPIDIPYQHNKITFTEVPLFNLLSIKELFSTIIKAPGICRALYKGMKQADHIHVRCPGNMGLLGCIIQIAFPKKKKTAKYAGNWDLQSKQPFTYKLQRKILRNTFLTRNMQVLVYGDWNDNTKNIKPFFTATYHEKDKKEIADKSYSGKLNLMFVGALSAGKQPLYVIELAQNLLKNGIDVKLDVYGDGTLRPELENYIANNNLSEVVTLMGNRTKQEVESSYRNNHFMILPSKSEGWPKVVAEAMFWGCIPIATKVSCVPYMLNEGRRGILLNMNLKTDTESLAKLIGDKEKCTIMRSEGAKWSRNYTLDYFDEEIKKLMM